MDRFNIIYKILKILEKAMDYEEFDSSAIAPERLRINEALWKNIIIMLVENGYVKNVVVAQGYDNVGVNVENIQITLKGLEYLNDNTMMKRIARTAKGIKEIKGIVD